MRKMLVRRVFPVITVLATVAGFGFGASPANAALGDAAATVYVGNATLPTFPCASAPAECTGGNFASTIAAGAGLQSAAPAVCLPPGCKVTSTGFSYTETCAPGQAAGAPLLGTAHGPFTESDATRTYIQGTFNWTRVGLTAVILINTTVPSAGLGASVAVFVPSTPVGDCGLPNGTRTNQTATVVGIGAGVATA